MFGVLAHADALCVNNSGHILPVRCLESGAQNCVVFPWCSCSQIAMILKPGNHSQLAMSRLYLTPCSMYIWNTCISGFLLVNSSYAIVELLQYSVHCKALNGSIHMFMMILTPCMMRQSCSTRSHNHIQDYFASGNYMLDYHHLGAVSASRNTIVRWKTVYLDHNNLVCMNLTWNLYASKQASNVTINVWSNKSLHGTWNWSP